MQKLKLGPYLSSCKKKNQPQMDQKSLKHYREKIGKILEDIGLGNYFLNGTSIAQQIRERNDV
jgi:hypothetical protein